MEITRAVPQEVEAPVVTSAESNPTKKAAKLPFTLATRLFLGVIATTPFLAGCNLPGNIPLPGQVRQSAEDCATVREAEQLKLYPVNFLAKFVPYFTGSLPKNGAPLQGYLGYTDRDSGQTTATDIFVRKFTASRNYIAASTDKQDILVLDGTTKKTVTILDGASLEQDDFVRLMRLSPDGKMLAVEIDNLAGGTETSKIVLASTDGSQRVIVDTDASGRKLGLNQDLVWSPDSQRIALASWTDPSHEGSDVYYANIVGEGQLIAKPAFQKAKSDPQNRFFLRWSADSQKVISEQQKEVPFGKLLTIKMYPDGSDLKQVVPGCADDSAYPSIYFNR